MQPLTDEQFDAIVQDALDEVPAELMALLDNVVFLVEPESPADDPDLLGIYEGTPLTDRGGWWEAGSLPDRITLFRGPLTRMCDDVEELRDEIAVTVVHEIAHHFGIEEDTLHELGLGLNRPQPTSVRGRSGPSSTRRSSRPGPGWRRTRR